MSKLWNRISKKYSVSFSEFLEEKLVICKGIMGNALNDINISVVDNK